MLGFSLFENVLVAIIMLANLVLAWISAAKARDREQGITLALFILAANVWIGAAFFSEKVPSFDNKLLLTKVTYSAVTLSLSFLLMFLAAFSGKIPGKKFIYSVVLSLGLLLALYIYFSGQVVNSITLVGSSFNVDFGSQVLIWTGYIVLSLFFGGYLVYFGYKRASLKEKRSFQLILIGIFIFIFINVIVNLILPLLAKDQNYYRFGNYSMIFLTGLTAYSIVARNLFEIRTITAAVFAVFINIFLFAEIFLSGSYTEAVLKTIVFGVVVAGSYLLVRNTSQEISRREEVEVLAKERSEALEEVELRNKNLAALQKISDIVLTQSEMTPMVQSILDELPHQLEDCFAALLNVVEDGHLVAYSYSKNNFSEKIEGLVGKDLSKYKYPLRAGFNLLHDSLLQKKKIGSEHLSDFVSPPLPKPVAGTLQRLTGIKYCEALPLHVNNEPFGALLLTFNAPKEQIQAHNLEIADSIADEVSIALQRTDTLQKLKDANEYLTQIDKMKDEFLSMASHELNTPLAAIEGYISMILDEHMGKVDAKSREYLNRAYESSKRLAALVIDLLNVSRIEQGRLKMKFVETNLVELSQSVVNELQIRADAKKIYLKVVGDKKKIPLTWCDPDRIREVIVNLAGNAIKFTEKGGITIKVSSANDYINIDVSDTGRGISEEGQKKLFQKFSQVNRAQDEHQGTGLGLYISKNFVELHNGKLTVQSQEGKGATFTVELPIMKKPPKEIKGAVLENTDSGLQIAPVGVPSSTPAAPASPVSAHSEIQAKAKS